jgi:hypothetical protein
VGVDDEFKRKLIEEVQTIDDEVQVIEVVNVEDDTGPFPKIELLKKWNIMKILNYHQKK